ncbi:hypothetical protein [Candidatus Finniella inopinata]|uniref:F0F1 ATP synthase subunit B family protein n=1 Tax=Candidatus Finniella inopinata TaxID=1696036 RepID=UPI0013EEDAF3|nr:hypothetical protein [Candidatus Finniella inopinata]
MPQFDISTYWSQIFWLVISFGTLLLTLKAFILPRFTGMLSGRQALMDQNKAKTKDLYDQQRVRQSQRLKRLEEAKEAAHALISQAVSEMDAFEAERIQQIHDQTNQKLLDFQADLENEKKSLEKDIESLVEQSVHHLLPKLLAGSER